MFWPHKTMNFFKKIQNLSEDKRRIIFWTVIILFVLVVFSIWLRGTESTIRNLKSGVLQGINLPERGVEEFNKKMEMFDKEKEAMDEKFKKIEELKKITESGQITLEDKQKLEELMREMGISPEDYQDEINQLESMNQEENK